VDSILTLTFTRKAAAEMYERIYGLLTEERDHPIIHSQLVGFDGADISTMDSFCSRIVRGESRLFGISSDFVTDEGEAGRVAESIALEFLLRRREQRICRELFHRFGFERVWKQLFASVAAGYLSIATKHDFREMATRQFSELCRLAESEAEEIERHRLAILALDDDGSTKSIASAKEAVGRLAPLPEAVRRKAWSEALAMVSGFSLRTPPSNAKSPTVIELREVVTELKREDGPLKQLPSVLQTLIGSDDLPAMAELMTEFQEEYFSQTRGAGILGFQDVMGMAIEVLRRIPEVRSYYKERYSHIMIDEFQDNNLKQKELLYLLAERRDRNTEGIPGAGDLAPGKLFFVGDEKQSIYRFRGADVSVFKELRGELEKYEGEFVSLGTNYRSDPGLIRFFNAFFPPVFGDARCEYEAEFQPIGARVSEPEEGENREGSVGSSIVLLYKPYRKDPPAGSLDSKDAEAFMLARYIRERVEAGDLPVGPDRRSAGYDDFAVLMRTLSNQVRYERMFRLLGIPYSTMSVRTLFLEAPLNDLYNLLQLLVYPEDRSAYAGLLRSPLVNLDDRLVTAILTGRREPFSYADITEVLKSSGAEAMADDLSPNEDAKYAAAAGMYAHLTGLVDRVSIGELIRLVWHEYGYRYSLMKNPANTAYLEFYDYFQAMARRADAGGEPLAFFVDLLRENLGRYERLEDLEIVKREQQGVQLLTIHKSKGLEFPVVVVADTGSVGAGNRGGLYFVDEEIGFSVNVSDEVDGKKRGVNYFYERAKRRERALDEAELKRILYVAMTRAEDHLILSGYHHGSNKRFDSKGIRKETDTALLNMILDGLGIGQVDDGSEAVPDQVSVGGMRVKAVEIGDITDGDLRVDSTGVVDAPIREIADAYEAAPAVGYSFPRRTYTPSQINHLHLRRHYPPTSGGGPRDVPFSVELPQGRTLPSISSDPVLRRHGLEDTFGTVCHFLIEERFRGVPPETRRSEAAGFFSSLESGDLDRVLDDAERVTETFFESGFCRSLLGSGIRDAGTTTMNGVRAELEVPFLLDCGEFFVPGRMDLLVYGEETATVVDFKTEHALREDEFAAQMTIYGEAAEALTGKPAECYLFYLRSGEAIKVDRGCDYRTLVNQSDSSPAE
jgi:ATP-dependent exoDNAse (exonuclease V) beta subunit